MSQSNNNPAGLPAGWTRALCYESGRPYFVDYTRRPPVASWTPPPAPAQQGPTIQGRSSTLELLTSDHAPAFSPSPTPPTRAQLSPPTPDGNPPQAPLHTIEEDPPAPTTAAKKKGNTVFSALDLQQIVVVTAELNPYLAPRSQKTKKWDAVAEELHKQGLCLTSSGETIKHKVDSLLKYHKTPNPRSEIARELQKHEGIEIAIAAKLDQLTALKDDAAQLTEEGKVKAREDEEKKTQAGKFIRDMAMTTVNKGHGSSDDLGDTSSSDKPDEPEDSGSDKENARKRKKKSRSSGRQAKRCRTIEDGTTDGLMKLIKTARDEDRRAREEDRRQRDQRDQRVIAIMEQTTRAQLEFQNRLLDAVLQGSSGQQ